MSMLEEQKQLKAHRDSVHRDCQFMTAKSKVDISFDWLIQKVLVIPVWFLMVWTILDY